MNITISCWVAYGILLFVNLNQTFWGFLLKLYRNERSLLTFLSHLFPMGVMCIFASVMGFVLTAAVKTETVITIFIFWAFITMITFIGLSIRQLKK